MKIPCEARAGRYLEMFTKIYPNFPWSQFRLLLFCYDPYYNNENNLQKQQKVIRKSGKHHASEIETNH